MPGRLENRVLRSAPRRRRPALLPRRLLAGLSLAGAVVGWLGIAAIGAAQAPGAVPTVHWSASAQKKSSGSRRGALTLELSGHVEPGWHVYALEQAPGGPTPLRLSLDANDFARLAGSPSGTAPERKYDPSFGLETQFYTGSFTLYLPVELTPQRESGRRVIPLSVRFQTCNGRECEPPRTVHLSVPLDGLPDA